MYIHANLYSYPAEYPRPNLLFVAIIYNTTLPTKTDGCNNPIRSYNLTMFELTRLLVVFCPSMLLERKSVHSLALIGTQHFNATIKYNSNVIG